MTSETPAPSPLEVRMRVVSLLLEPVCSLAARLGIPLRELQDLLALVYSKRLRVRGRSWTRIARDMDLSRRAVATLAKRARDMSPATEQLERMRNERQILAILERKQPATLEALSKELPNVDEGEVEALVSELLGQGLLHANDSELELDFDRWLRIREDADARLDGLRHLLETLTRAVEQRFGFSPARVGLARTLTFGVRRHAAQKVADALSNALLELATQADSDAGRDGEPTEQMSALIAIVTESK